MTRSVFRKVMAVGVAVAAVTGLAGCSTDPRTAAVVDDRVISQSELTQVYDEVQRAGIAVPPAGVLFYLIVAPDEIDTAAANGAAVSEEDARAWLEDAMTGAGLDSDIDWSTSMIQFVRSALSKINIDGLPNSDEVRSEFWAAVGSREVTVNPQYGEWGTGGLGPVSYDWLAGAPAGVE